MNGSASTQFKTRRSTDMTSTLLFITISERKNFPKPTPCGNIVPSNSYSKGNYCSCRFKLELVESAMLHTKNMKDKVFCIVCGRGAQYIDSDIPVDLKGTAGRSHGITTMTDTIRSARHQSKVR